MKTEAEALAKFQQWLESCRRQGKLARNTVAMGIVVLDHLAAGPRKKSDVVSAGGEIARSRNPGPILTRHGIPAGYLKSCTTRQTHQDGQRLFEAFKHGKALADLPASDRTAFLQKAFAILTAEAHAWLNRKHLRIPCDPSLTPLSWIEDMIAAAKGRSGGKVEQHLIGAKLSARHPNLVIANHPGHAGDQQTGRDGDFTIGETCYHVTVAPGAAVIDKCAENLQRGLLPVLLVPTDQVVKARSFAEVRGIQKRLLVVSLEDFIAVNVVEMAEDGRGRIREVMQQIIRRYNERLMAVETDHSLKIELA